jgi:hypothetical protein
MRLPPLAALFLSGCEGLRRSQQANRTIPSGSPAKGATLAGAQLACPRIEKRMVETRRVWLN